MKQIPVSFFEVFCSHFFWWDWRSWFVAPKLEAWELIHSLRPSMITPNLIKAIFAVQPLWISSQIFYINLSSCCCLITRFLNKGLDWSMSAYSRFSGASTLSSLLKSLGLGLIVVFFKWSSCAIQCTYVWILKREKGEIFWLTKLNTCSCFKYIWTYASCVFSFPFLLFLQVVSPCLLRQPWCCPIFATIVSHVSFLLLLPFLVFHISFIFPLPLFL